MYCIYFDELTDEQYPNGCWAASSGDPSDGVDTGLGDTPEQAIADADKFNDA